MEEVPDQELEVTSPKLKPTRMEVPLSDPARRLLCQHALVLGV